MNLRINGRTPEVPNGSTMLQSARLAGVQVPTLCHDDRLKPAGACRLCLVQVRGIHHLIPALHDPFRAWVGRTCIVPRALVVSAIIALLALSVFGFMIGHFTGVPKSKSALQTALVGSLAAGVAW